MRRIEGAAFTMGSDRFYPEEAPARRARLENFWIDETAVTNRAFAAFVDATGHRTAAEVAPDPSGYPGMSDEMAQPGSLVFRRPAGPVDLSDSLQWWSFCPGADWRHPDGADSTIDGLEDHPVVHVAFADASSYAAWAGKSLPTEVEWECAARGGLDGLDFAWGDDLAPAGRMMANYWQGAFPIANQMLDGFENTSPVGSFPANDFGLYDMIGNVWEWTRDRFHFPKQGQRSCCVSAKSRGGRSHAGQAHASGDMKVLKGGSYLCAPNYCQRYRPAARLPQAVDTSSCHIGFRCVVRSVATDPGLI